VNLILFDPAEIRADHSVDATGVHARHLTRVLKVTPGQSVRVGIVDGPMGVGVVSSIGDDHVTLDCTFEPHTPERPLVDLLLALPRPKVMRRLWPHLASLGVGHVILTNAEKVERDYFDTHLLQPGGFRPLLIEGLQQARDTRLPRVSVHKQFRKLIEAELEGLCPDSRRIVAHPDTGGVPGSAPSVADVLRDRTSDTRRVLLGVGPEGGWNTFELDLLASAGFTRVSMGERTLATTTACIALLALVHAVVDYH
jgi:RsmE family RNA methyltransferase